MSAPEPTTTNLPPRKRLHAATAAPLPTWHAARTTDHAGQPAHAVWFGSSSSSPPPTATSFQIYTTTTTTTAAPPTTTDPAAAALSAVRLLLGGSGPDELPALRTARRIDVYAGMPDVLACVEHQRREIRARSGGGAARIPGFAASAYEKPRGLAVLLAVRAEEDGPVFVWFERRGGAGRRVRVPGDLEVEEGGELALERVEVEAVRIRVWDAVEGEMRRVRVEDVDEGDVNSEDDESAAKAGEDEGEGGKKGGAATRPQHHLNISSEVDTAGDTYIIMDNIPTEAVSHNNIHLSYIVYDLSGSEDLTAVAHSFTASLLYHLPSTTIVRIEFHQAPTLAASIERCHLELRARPDLCIGYLDNQSGLHSRIFPSSPRIEAAIDKHRAHTLGHGVQMSGLSVFVVALENKNEDGVLLVRANPDLGALKQLMGRNPDDETVTVAKAVELLVGRPPGMAAVAARLAGNL